MARFLVKKVFLAGSFLALLVLLIEVIFEAKTFSVGVTAGFHIVLGFLVGFFVMVYFRESKKIENNYERELYSSEERYRMIFENSPLGMFHFNKDGEITHSNDKLIEILGSTKRDIIGFNMLTQINDNKMQAALETALTGRVGYYEGDYVSGTSKKELSLKAIFKSVTSDTGEFIGGIGIYEDVTAKKEIEKEIARLDMLDLVGQMAASIGHEVRNPMTSIRGFLQLLENKEADQHKKEYYEIMISELDRANSIIKEFLTLAKNKRVELSLLDLNSVLNDLLPLMLADAIRQDKFIILKKNYIHKLFLDCREVRQLILNLVRNGLEATPTGKDLVITTYESAGKVFLSVADEGLGIPPEVVSKLGTPFFTTKDTGTGLGLAVCYSIANRHNAKIEVQTGTSGTTFLVKFNPLWQGAS